MSNTFVENTVINKVFVLLIVWFVQVLCFMLFFESIVYLYSSFIEPIKSTLSKGLGYKYSTIVFAVLSFILNISIIKPSSDKINAKNALIGLGLFVLFKIQSFSTVPYRTLIYIILAVVCWYIPVQLYLWRKSRSSKSF